MFELKLETSNINISVKRTHKIFIYQKMLDAASFHFNNCSNKCIHFSELLKRVKKNILKIELWFFDFYSQVFFTVKHHNKKHLIITVDDTSFQGSSFMAATVYQVFF